VARLEADYYIPIGRLRAAARERSSCNLIHLATMFTIDIFVPKDRECGFAGAARHRNANGGTSSASSG
jgi:hypothetical protein